MALCYYDLRSANVLVHRLKTQARDDSLTKTVVSFQPHPFIFVSDKKVHQLTTVKYNKWDYRGKV